MLYWYEGLAGWASLTETPPEVPIGTAFHLAPQWLNQSAEPISGHIELTITKPDGTKVTLNDVLYQDNWAIPGNWWGVQFEPFTMDQAGTYRATATLSTTGESLDEKTFNIATVRLVLDLGEIEILEVNGRQFSSLSPLTLTSPIVSSNPKGLSILVKFRNKSPIPGGDLGIGFDAECKPVAPMDEYVCYGDASGWWARTKCMETELHYWMGSAKPAVGEVTTVSIPNDDDPAVWCKGYYDLLIYCGGCIHWDGGYSRGTLIRIKEAVQFTRSGHSEYGLVTCPPEVDPCEELKQKSDGASSVALSLMSEILEISSGGWHMELVPEELKNEYRTATYAYIDAYYEYCCCKREGGATLNCEQICADIAYQWLSWL